MRRQRGWSRGFTAAVAVSVLLHAVMFGLVLNRLMSSPSGGGGHLLDAIEIEVVDAQALESTSPNVAQAGGTVATSDTAGAAPAATPMPAAAATKPAPAQAAADPVPVEQRDADLVAGSDRPTLKIETPPVVTTDATRVVEPFETAAPTTSAAAVMADAGGSTVSAPIASLPSPAAAAASPGEVARFNAAVRKALANNRPKPGWPSGRVLLAFSVSDTGHVENAELVEASANARLNRLTLAWINTIAMPEPPRGLPLADRRYSIPLTVK
jgi:TonB family protein